MVKININISDEMFAAMKRFSNIDWNEVAVDGITNEIQIVESKQE